MKTEQEIVLQKKMIIIFSLIILAIIMGILNIQKGKIKIAKLEKENEMQIYTAYNAEEQFLTIELSGEEIDVVENVPGIESLEKNDISNTKSENEQTDNKENIKETNENSAQRQVVVASRGSYTRETNVPPTEYERMITVKATAYCLCMKCCGKAPDSPGYGNTASGLKIIPNTGMKVIAVDPSVVPLGTEVYIEGLNGASNYGYAIAADTGSAIKNNKIDLYMDTHEQALSWGVRTVNMYILGE